MNRSLGVLFFSVWVSQALPAQQPVGPRFPAPLHVHASTVYPGTIGGEALLLYELHLQNLGHDTLWLDRIVARGDGDSLFSIGPGSWGAVVTSLPPIEPNEDGRLTLSPGPTWTIYVWQPDPHTGASRITHDLQLFDGPGPDARPIPARPVPATVGGQPLTIDSPVRGGIWFVGNGFGPASNHRRFMTVLGEPRIPQRFGADFTKLDASGANAPGGSTTLIEFQSMHEPVFAVADGVVARVVDGLPDEPVGGVRSHLGWEEMPGNHILLEFADSAFAVYAHLKAGTISVHPGDRVQRGDSLAVLGNSGNSAVPHLHFHVADRPHPIDGESIPFVFREFELMLDDYRFRPEQRPLPAGGRIIRGTLPALRWVIRFPS